MVISKLNHQILLNSKDSIYNFWVAKKMSYPNKGIKHLRCLERLIPFMTASYYTEGENIIGASKMPNIFWWTIFSLLSSIVFFSTAPNIFTNLIFILYHLLQFDNSSLLLFLITLFAVITLPPSYFSLLKAIAIEKCLLFLL